MSREYRECTKTVIVPPTSGSMGESITPTKDHFVVSHFGTLRVQNPDNWRLEVSGEVDRQLSLSLSQISDLPVCSELVALECAGNPRNLHRPLRRVSCSIWRGARLNDLLAISGVRPNAKCVWLSGADSGCYAGEHADEYTKEIPLDKTKDVIIAYGMNDGPLTPEHGYPVRAIVPGFYGTNSVKWLQRIRVSKESHKGLFTTTLYNEEVVSRDGISQKWPIRDLAVNSRITRPSAGEVLEVGSGSMCGWAWGASPVMKILFTIDGNNDWREAACAGRSSPFAWQAFYADLPYLPPGDHTISVKAYAENGQSQPPTNRINAIETVEFVVRDKI